MMNLYKCMYKYFMTTGYVCIKYIYTQNKYIYIHIYIYIQNYPNMYMVYNHNLQIYIVHDNLPLLGTIGHVTYKKRK